MELIEIQGENFCCFEEFRLPLQGQGLVWVTGANEDTKSADNNGSGKTTLFKALTWGLFGQTIDGEKGDKVIRSGQKAARVRIVLGDDEKRWTVVRERRKGSPRLQLLQPDGEPFEAGKDALQERIIEMVGLDFPAFKNTVLYGQNDSARFAHPRTKDSERKEMLHRILRTGILKDCHELALAHRLKLKKQLGSIDRNIRDAKIILGEQDIEGLQKDVEDFEAQRAETIKRHKANARGYKEEATNAIASIDDVVAPDGDTDDLKEEIEALEEALKAAEEAAKKSQAVEEELKPLEEDEIKAMEVRAKAGAALGGSKATLERLDGQDRCPTCNSSLDEGEALEFIKAVKKEVKDREKKRDKSQKKLNAIREKIKAGRERQEEHDAVARKERSLIEQLHEADAQLEKWKFRERSAEAEREAIRERVASFIEAARRELAQAKDVKKQTNLHAERLARAKKKRKEVKDQLKSFSDLKKEHTTTLAHVEFWVRGFSNQGLPSYILDAVMPYIANRANHYLETLADGDITMDFSTQREMKSGKGEMRDEIDISWEIEGLEDSYPPSGGQLKKMEIATDLALMDLVATREGENVDILALDEILDGLDAEGRQRVLMLLLEMRSRRGSVFVISHETEMSEVFEKSITVKKDEGVSTLSM